MVRDGGHRGGCDGAVHCFGDLADFGAGHHSGDDGGHHSGDDGVHQRGDGVLHGGGYARCCQHH